VGPAGHQRHPHPVGDTTGLDTGILLAGHHVRRGCQRSQIRCRLSMMAGDQCLTQMETEYRHAGQH
jgi:hypothetical protein